MVALQSCVEIGSRRRDRLKASIRTFTCDELDEIIALDNILKVLGDTPQSRLFAMRLRSAIKIVETGPAQPTALKPDTAKFLKSLHLAATQLDQQPKCPDSRATFDQKMGFIRDHRNMEVRNRLADTFRYWHVYRDRHVPPAHRGYEAPRAYAEAAAEILKCFARGKGADLNIDLFEREQILAHEWMRNYPEYKLSPSEGTPFSQIAALLVGPQKSYRTLNKRRLRRAIQSAQFMHRSKLASYGNVEASDA